MKKINRRTVAPCTVSPSRTKNKNNSYMVGVLGVNGCSKDTLLDKAYAISIFILLGTREKSPPFRLRLNRSLSNNVRLLIIAVVKP